MKEEQPRGFSGIGDDGDEFRIKYDTIDNPVQSLLNPRNMSIISFITVCFCGFSLVSALLGTLSPYVHVVLYMFFRLCYNVGLGIALKQQSKYRTFTKWFKRMRRGGVMDGLLDHVIRSQLDDKNANVRELPPEVGAWIVFRVIVDFILVNTEVNFFASFMVCFHFDSVLTLRVFGLYAVGLFLVWLSLATKLAAHRVLGSFGWYYGDFFFRKIQNLTFDGIFQMFPHPMYTVGYLYYVGCTLIAQSYLLFAVSVIGHSLQIGFLFLVEEPHIQAMYSGNSVEEDSDDDDDDIGGVLDHSTYFASIEPSISLLYINPTRSSDVVTALLVVYVVLSSWYMDLTAAVLQLIVWRLIHWIGASCILWLQSKDRKFTQYFVRNGLTEHHAFHIWQVLYNVSVTVNVVAFCVCTLKEVPMAFPSWWTFVEPFVAARVVVGSILIVLGSYIFANVHMVIGNYHFFYGDFFIPQEKYEGNVSLVYEGVYRFVNNPDALLGYLGQYGAAIVLWSHTLFVVAAASQCAHVVFLNVVEIPYMKRMYACSRRSQSAISHTINRNLKKSLGKVKEQKWFKEFRQAYTRIKRVARAKVKDVAKKVRSRIDRKSD